MANTQPEKIGQFHLKLGADLKAEIEREAERLCLKPTDFIRMTMAERLSKWKEVTSGKGS